MQDRTDPNNYGPPQIDPNVDLATQLGPMPSAAMRLEPFKEALKLTKPEESYLLDSVGGKVKLRGNFDFLMSHALQSGSTTQDIRNSIQAAEDTDKALKLAEASMQMSDQEFNDIFKTLETEMGSRPETPQIQQPNAPNPLASALAAIIGVVDPQHAFDVASVPLQYEQQQAQMRFEQDKIRYGEAVARRNEKIDLLEMKLKYADRNRQEAKDKVYQLAQEAQKRGEVKNAQGLAARGAVYGAGDEAEFESRLDYLKANYPEHMLDPQFVAARRKMFKDAEFVAQENAKRTVAKEKWEREEKTVDNFRQWVGTQFQGADISQEDADYINAQAAQKSKDSGIPLSRFDKYVPRVNTAQAFQKQKYADSEEARGIGLQIDKSRLEKLQGDIARQKTAPPKDKVEKSKQQKKLQSEWENAKRDTDALMLARPNEEDEQALATYYANLEKAIAKEYLIIRDKRKMGGQDLTMQQYMRERFPSGGFLDKTKGIITGVIGDSRMGNKSTPTNQPIQLAPGITATKKS